MQKWGVISQPINFLGDPWNARLSVMAANVWRGIPFVAISLLAGLQTIPQSLNEAAAIDGATRWQMFTKVTLPLLTPIIAVVMTFSVLFTFTDFQLIYVLTRGGPVNATHLMATLSFQRAIPGGQLGEGAAIAVAMIPSFWRRSCSASSASSAASGNSKTIETRASWRKKKTNPPKPSANTKAAPAASWWSGCRWPASCSCCCSLLLDGDHGGKTELPDDGLPQLQPALGGRADAAPHQIPAV
ncbi:sugar ABC transporter permease [Paracoccus cavernae]|uniref:Sugar ABC transporter permease n=1 Tax=Paracoccus cavernae TaxID=1571207 RepID=A0ABT8DDV5_9RHOB|nr:sugar ABC transporter permease [Paracoccus cavernae]